MKELPLCPAAWNKILVGCDGSEEGRHAVSEALVLAQACHSQLAVLRVLEVRPEFEAVAPDVRATLEAEARTEMERVKAEAAQLEVPLQILVRLSQLPHAAIVQEAQEIQADLIIMGRSGRSGLARLLLGSVTARVIGYSPVNVLVVSRETSLSFRRLLVGSDGSPQGDAAWEVALSLAKEAGSELFGISAAREEGDILEAQEILHRMLVGANEAGLPFHGLSPQGQQPDDAIVQAAIRQEISLIILGSHGRTGFQRLLLGSVTERVTGQAPCPVLVVKKK
jgi:nucleotide-binding universal stress UspA family protein